MYLRNEQLFGTNILNFSISVQTEKHSNFQYFCLNHSLVLSITFGVNMVMVCGLLGSCSQGESTANHVQHVKRADCVCYRNAQQVSRSWSWSHSSRILSWTGKLILLTRAMDPLSFHYSAFIKLLNQALA